MSEWDVQFGTYRCINCGELMISLVETDGRVLYREVPLACPWCDDDLIVVVRRLPRALPKSEWRCTRSAEQVQALYDAFDAGRSPYGSLDLLDYLMLKAAFMLKSWRGERIKEW
jgi:DNA-directed RNA polymerase subunit RPC12/RpoP